jgi:muramoyltetrapeptide carboxypeptidase LdcA involved in peptidoglycan recycling
MAHAACWQTLTTLGYALLKEAGTQIMGYSDFTAIQLALLAKGGIAAMPAPCCTATLVAANISPLTMQHFIQQPQQKTDRLTPPRKPACNSRRHILGRQSERHVQSGR